MSEDWNADTAEAEDAGREDVDGCFHGIPWDEECEWCEEYGGELL